MYEIHHSYNSKTTPGYGIANGCIALQMTDEKNTFLFILSILSSFYVGQILLA